MSNLKEEMFLNSNAGQQCIKYLETLQNTEIENKKAIEISDKYTMMFYDETHLGGAIAYINCTFIPICLFKKYNITVVKDKVTNSINNTDNTYLVKTEIERKTAPTLIDGWYIYIIVILVLSIFKERILGWIVTTIIFILWRANEIDKYN
jgi:hypothetical protein